MIKSQLCMNSRLLILLNFCKMEVANFVGCSEKEIHKSAEPGPTKEAQGHLSPAPVAGSLGDHRAGGPGRTQGPDSLG